MNRLGKISTAVAVILLLNLQVARAAEVLSNGGFEMGAGPANWTLTQSVVGLPGAPVNATEQVDFANQEAPATGLGLLVKSHAGNIGTYDGQNRAVNVTLSQTFSFGPSAAGRTYTFEGNSFFQLASSNNLLTLGELYPTGDYNQNTVVDAADYTIWRDTLGSIEDLRANGDNVGLSSGIIDQADFVRWKERFGNTGHGAIPSPTQTKFELAFLDASDTVLGTQVLDLPRNRPTDELPQDWQTHTVSKVAPAGTTKIRASVIITDMVASCSVCTAGQDVYFDNFSLRDGVLTTNRLQNGNLDAPGAPVDFTIEKTPEDNIQFTNASFAVHSGNQGLWLRSFSGGDAKVFQVVDATAGAQYDFSAWAKLQPGYSGLDPSSDTQTFIRMEFLDSGGQVIPGADGTKSYDLRNLVWPDGEDNQGVWQQVPTLTAIAPAGTVDLRVSVGATGMVNTEVGLPQSAMFDDLSLIETLPGVGAIAAVPEPSSLLLLVLACGSLGCSRMSR